MEPIILFLTYFISIYVIYFIFVILMKGKEDKYKKSSQIKYFVKKYNLNFDKISYNKFLQILAITNSFIMAITATIVNYLPHLMLKLFVAFILLIILILVCYKVIGVYIERRNKNV